MGNGSLAPALRKVVNDTRERNILRDLVIIDLMDEFDQLYVELIPDFLGDIKLQ